MRSLFHFPLPAQPPSQQPSPTATVSLQSEMCHRPHPAPMRRQRRSPALLSAARPLPRSRAYLDPAHGPLSPAPRAPAMPRPHPCLAPPPAPIAPHHLSTAPLLPAPPRPHRAHRVPPSASLYVATEQIPRSSPPHRAHRVPTSASRPISLLALRRPQGPGRQEPHRMHPFFAECAKKAPFLATSARNACFSRSEWQHPRPMHPFPGAIGRFGIHGARILPPRALFRVEEPEITHGAKMLPAPRGLSAAAACGPAEWALRHAAAACGTRHGRTGFAPCGAGLACLPHARPLPSRLCPPRPAPPAISPAFIAAVLYASRFAVRDPPRGPRTDASRYLRAAPIPPATRAHRVQETSGTAQTTQCGHKNRIPK